MLSSLLVPVWFPHAFKSRVRHSLRLRARSSLHLKRLKIPMHIRVSSDVFFTRVPQHFFMDDALQIRRESPASGPTLARPVKWGQAPLTNGSETESDFFLPVGAVTLLLGDVEGSTRLWEERPTLIAEEMRWLSQAVSESVGLHNGVKPLEQGEGDSFVAAFARPSDAIACALDVQLQLAERSLLLRMGVHTGEVQLRGADNYAGVTVNRAARLRDSAHGGQVVLSAATRNLVLDHLPPDVTLLDLGAHHLKDLMRPEQIYQLVHPKLVKEFPPLRSLGTFQTNLPIQLTSFVGRGQEIEALRGLLANNRLVTLLGIGGCGKTRLALQVAAEMLEDHPGGTWMVDLSSATDTASIPAAIATALGIRETPGADLLRMAASYIGERPTLLVFDNCEHMIYECAEALHIFFSCHRGLASWPRAASPWVLRERSVGECRACLYHLTIRHESRGSQSARPFNSL